MPEEMNIGDALVESMSEAPMEEAPVAQQVPVQQEAQAPAFDPTMFNTQFASQSDQINAIAKQMEQLGSRIPEPQKPAPTEQEVIAQELKRQLGIDGLEGKLTQQEQLINEQNQKLAQYEAYQQRLEAEKALSSLEVEFGAFDREVIKNKIAEIGKTNPALAEALNSPDGARMLLSQGVGLVNNTPDAITPSSNNTDIGSDQTLDRIRDGKASQDDFGSMLLQYVQ